MSTIRSGKDSKPFAIETTAYGQMKFYAENYESLFFKGLKPGSRKILLGGKTSFCRFCRRSSPEVKFSKDAHVLPAFIGNKTLFSNFECNECNDRFSSFEDDLAKMTMGDRALSQVPKRSGFTPLKPQGKKSSFERSSNGVLIKQYIDEGIFTIDEENSRVVIKYDTQPYRQLGAYKSLAKMAYTLLPENELPNVEELRKWLLESDVSTAKVYGAGSHWCYQTFVPGPAPFSFPVAALLRRKSDITAPYLMFFLAFGNWSYQIFAPCPQKDSSLSNNKIEIVPYPHFYMLQPWLAPGPIQRIQLILDDEARKSDSKTLNMHFDSIE